MSNDETLKELKQPMEQEGANLNPESINVEEEKEDVTKKKYINIMYVNRVSYLEANGVPTDLYKLSEFIKTRINPMEFALILHDKDTTKKGEPADPHIHVALRFKSARYLTSIAKKFKDPIIGNVRKWDKNYKNMYSYLTHLTTEAQAQKKFQYPFSDVIATFDYNELMMKIFNELILPRKKVIVNLLNDYGYGKITFEELEKELTPAEYSDYATKIKVITKDILNKADAQNFQETMDSEQQKIKTFFCFGTTGTGKTFWAKELAKKNDISYYITGSERDPFANYEGQELVILDEIRPDSMSYSELLKILDPYNFEVVAGSRYYDKQLLASTFILTTPFSPKEFYNTFTADKNESSIHVIEKSGDSIDDIYTIEIDSPLQLYRRITPLEFTKDSITPLQWDEEKNQFTYLEDLKEPNKWASDKPFASKKEIADDMNFLFGTSNEDYQND